LGTKFREVARGRYAIKFLLLVLAIHFIVEVIVKRIKQRKVEDKAKKSNRCRKEGNRRSP
jgi:hypothetical protein